MRTLRILYQKQPFDRSCSVCWPGSRRFLTRKTETPPPRSFFQNNPLKWYSKVIDSHPLVVKCTTACIVSGAGDIASQKLAGKERVDWAQTARFAGMNLVVVGPTLHFWYKWLAQRYPGNSLISVAKRVFWDEFIFTPFYYPIFLTILWKLEQGAALTTDRIKDMLWNEMPGLIVVEWAIYIPAQAANFRFIPVKFQVLFSNVVGIVWNGFLSGMAQHAHAKQDQREGGKAKDNR